MHGRYRVNVRLIDVCVSNEHFATCMCACSCKSVSIYVCLNMYVCVRIDVCTCRSVRLYKLVYMRVHMCV